MSARAFGVLADGAAVDAFTIARGPIQATVLSWGATLSDLRVGGRPVLLGFDDLQSYLDHKGYFGAVAGRCANRIADGRFFLDGEPHQLAVNDGAHHLHGGPDGFGVRNWRVVNSDASTVTLAISSPDGDQGYPGAVEATARYTATEDGLEIEFAATADRPTLVNLAAHGYFNLDGSQTILDHRVTIAADRYLPVDETLIPTGEARSVDDGVFDFRVARPIRNADGQTYDHNFCLAEAPSPEPRFAARVEVPGLTMELWTTEPGLQFYDGNFLPVAPPLRNGRHTVKHSGLCLEPQRWPNAANHDGFAGAVLRPGERYRQVTQYRFAVS